MDDEDFIEQQRGWRESILTIVLVGVGCIGGFVFLMLVTWGMFLYVLLALAGLAAVVFLNWLLWGRGMMRATAGEREEEELRASLERQPWELSEPEQPRHL
jgi:hypothetical protein